MADNETPNTMPAPGTRRVTTSNSPGQEVTVDISNQGSSERETQMIKLLASVGEGINKQSDVVAELLSITKSGVNAQIEQMKDDQRDENLQTDPEPEPTPEAKGPGLRGAISGFVKDSGGKLGLLSKVGLAATIAPFAIGFVSSVFDRIKEAIFGPDDGIEEEESLKSLILGAAGKGGIFALIGGLISKRLIVPAFFAGVFSDLFGAAIIKFQDLTGIDLGSKAEGIAKIIGAAIGLFIPSIIKNYLPRLLTKALGLGIVAKGVGAAGTGLAGAGAGAAAAGASRFNQLFKVDEAKVPTGTRVNASGQVVENTGRPGRPRQVKGDELTKRLAQTNRAAKFKGLLKFMRLPGAFALVPGLINVGQMVANDAPTGDIAKELTVALGAAIGGGGGAALGAMLGTLGFPGIGTGVGALVGGIAGGFFGDKVVRMAVNAMLGGSDTDVLSGETAPTAPTAPGTTGTTGNINPSPATTASANASIAQMQANGGAGFNNPFAGGAGSAFMNSIGDLVQTTNVGGASTVVNVVNAGSSSLSNAPHLMANQAV